MKLKLRRGTYHSGSDDGTFLLTHKGPVTLPGSQLHRWIDRLAGHLGGDHTLAELTDGLPAERKAAVEKVVSMLIGLGVVVEIADSPTEAHRPEVAFLDDVAGSGPNRFARWATISAVVLGDGELARAVLDAAATAGLRRVRSSSRPGGAGLVFDVSHRLDVERAERLERECADAALYQAVAVGDAVLLGPTGGISLALRRFRGRSTVEPMGPVAHRVIANQLVHRAFTELAAGTPRSTVVTRVDVRTLCTTTHPLRPDERAVGFSQRANSLSDDLLGVFGRIDEGDLAQFPVHVARTTVGPYPVLGAGVDFATARHRTALRALTVAAVGSFPLPLGATAGFSRDEAVTEGLLAHCRALVAAEPGSGPEIDLDRVDLDPAGARYRCLAAALPEPVVARDLTGLLGVPAVAMSFGGTTAHACGLTMAEAVRDGLERVLLAFQARVNAQPEYAKCAPVGLSVSGADRLVSTLARHGKAVEVVPVETGPDIAGVLPFVVRVMVRDG